MVVHESENTLQALDDGYILQEFIPSTEFAPNIYYNDDRSTCIVLKKTKLKQGIVGNASAVMRVDEPDIAELALDAAEAIGLSGPIDMDIRRRWDGTAVVLDVNARFGANIAYAPEVLDAALVDCLHGEHSLA